MTARCAFAIAVIAVSLPAALPAAEAPAVHHDVSVLHCARLLDTLAGRMLGETTVIIDSGRIKELHAGAVDPRPYQ
ncbi:MAG TPA: amidohydrolase family protein, partial [Rhodanobacter sp.]